MNKKIGIFDSGIGGTTTLKEIQNILPNEDIIYYADSKNNPYGSKTKEELELITSNIVDYLIKRDIKIIVIACNTATTNCIDYLRNKYKDIIFIGTEPAIKVACDKNYKNILVLATPTTISSERTHELVNNNKKDYENFYLVPCNGLANAIERNDTIKIDELLKEILTPYQDKNIDAIVLGCTHYPLIKNKIQSYFKNAQLIDGNKGVANQVKYQLQNNNLLKQNNTKSKIEFIQTK